MKRIILACGLVMFIGCGGDGLNLAPVEGVVTLNGEPVADAGIVFSPVDTSQGPPASGSTDSKGHFTLMTNNRTGAAIGDHRVAISKADPFGDEYAQEELDLEDADIVRRRGLTIFKTKHFMPPKYADVATSELTATVKKSDNSFTFPLTSE